MTLQTVLHLLRGSELDVHTLTPTDGLVLWTTDSHYLVIAQGGSWYRLGPFVLWVPPVGGLVDHFTDTDGTLLSAHTMDSGPGWTLPVGSMQIQSDEAVIIPTGDSHAITDAAVTDYTASVVVTVPAGSSWEAGVIVRWTDPNNYWIVLLNDGHGVRIVEFAAGTPTVHVEDGSAPAPGTHTLAVTVSGSTISATLDGVARGSFGPMATGLSSTHCGIHGWMGGSLNAVHLDDFRTTT